MPDGAIRDSPVQVVREAKQNRPVMRLLCHEASQATETKEQKDIMKKTLSALAIVALSASLAVAAPGGEGRGEGRGFKDGGKHHRGAGFNQKMAEKLGLTDAQKQQLAALQNRFKSEQATFREANKAVFEQYRAARKADDKAKLEALRPQMEALRTQMNQTREAQHNEILSILTAEQKAQLAAWKSQHKGGKRGRTE